MNAPPESGQRILVIDDERVMREGCSRICQSLGCEVVTAEEGSGGIQLLKEQEVDVLLLDMMMPGISGMEILEWIQEQAPDLVVIVITGYATVELAVEAMKKGAYDFISKPFTPDQLRLVLRRALERRRLQREAERLREERARSLRDIAEEQSRLRTIIQAMADGVLVTDRDGVVVLHNPPAGRFFGLQDEPLVGRPVTEVAPAEVGAMIRRLLSEPPGTARAVELAVDGVGDLRANAGPVYLDHEDLLGTVTVVQDITALKEMDRMKSDFVAMVSHELRSPLSVVHQQLEVIRRGMVGTTSEKQQTILQRTQERVQGLIDLINDLLDLARIEAGCVVARREPLTLGPLVEKTVNSYHDMAVQSGLNVICETDAELPTVVGDPDALEGVFVNLLSNAIAYTPRDGTICVKAAKRGDYACIEISDNGVGIPPEALSKIFDRFYRVKDEKTRHVVGTGLGLPIVKGIIEAHLGTVEVESKPGQGSTFRVLLPRYIPAAEIGSPEPQQSEETGGF
jgi:two-component system phosphate regulon sensor histidine kinase PhoR